jgi:hypothetical protein
MTEAHHPMTEAHHETAKPEEDHDKAGRPDKKPRLNAVGQPEPATGEPVQSHHPHRPTGERQDGPGVAPPRADRTDAVPAGATRARRKGTDQGQPEEPDAAHRGQPASFRTGAAEGSGASAGGTRHGAPEDPATDAVAGAGRKRGFSADRPADARR